MQKLKLASLFAVVCALGACGVTTRGIASIQCQRLAIELAGAKTMADRSEALEAGKAVGCWK